MVTERPKYRIASQAGFFGPDDHLYQEDEEIYFDGEPNEDMVPLNTAAEDRMVSYIDKLDKLAEEAAKKFNRPFSGRPRSIDGVIALARHDETLRFKVMGAEKDKGGIEKVTPENTPETGTTNPKRGPGRPRYKNMEAVG